MSTSVTPAYHVQTNNYQEK